MPGVDLPWALVIVRALHFGAVATMVGGAGLALALRRADRQAVTALRGASLLAALSGGAWFALVFASVTDGPSGLIDPEAWGGFLSAPFGWPWLVRVALCGVALALAAGRAPAAVLALGMALAIDQAWLGHAANGAGLGAATQIGFYGLHVLAGFAWTGALVMLCVFTLETGEVPADGLALFSTAGLFIVAAIVASGLVNASLRGLSLATLTSSPYGRILTVKLALFAAMIGFALFNRARRDAAGRSIRASLIAETLLGLGVLAVVALLGLTPPP